MTDHTRSGTTTSPVSAPPPGTGAEPAAQPPETSLFDLLRLLSRMAGAFLRGPGRFSAAEVFGRWLHDLLDRHASTAIVVKAGPKRILVVGGDALSRDILEPAPAEHTFVAGPLKAKAMSFLAEHALTVADGAEWTMLRRYNEQVLSTGHPHDHQRAFLDVVRAAFARPVSTIEDFRAQMAAVMLGIVFGDDAPARLADDVRELFGLVQSPIRRRLAGGRGRALRARFYDDVRAAWLRAADEAGADVVARAHASLLGDGRHYGVMLTEHEALQQVPHGMFTFTGSGTDLLVRGLALIAARPAVRARALQEIASAGSLDDALAIANLHYIEACVREAGRLFPPVTRTFHRAPAGAIAGGYRIADNVEVLHYLPLLYRYGNGAPDAHAFQPDRWLDDAHGARPYPDMFLSGARACPGQDLILFVCKAAAASLLARGITAPSRTLAHDPLPLTFPRKEARFSYADHS